MYICLFKSTEDLICTEGSLKIVSIYNKETNVILWQKISAIQISIVVG